MASDGNRNGQKGKRKIAGIERELGNISV